MLPINYTYKNLNDRDKNFIQDYLPKKLERITNLIQKFPEGSCRLDVKIESFATKSAYKLELSLHLPGKTIMAQEDDHTILEVVDLSFDKLIIQLRKLINKK